MAFRGFRLEMAFSFNDFLFLSVNVVSHSCFEHSPPLPSLSLPPFFFFFVFFLLIG
uniref:Uncharacterized protein n=1 Tax=Manihot esculenta TaxID=3983 RepID=A0A2C9VT32_MANES